MIKGLDYYFNGSMHIVLGKRIIIILKIKVTGHQLILDINLNRKDKFGIACYKQIAVIS